MLPPSRVRGCLVFRADLVKRQAQQDVREFAARQQERRLAEKDSGFEEKPLTETQALAVRRLLAQRGKGYRAVLQVRVDL